MKICNDKKHDEIVFEGGNFSDCPLCVAIDEHEDAVKDLKETISELESEIAQLEKAAG